MPVVALQSAAVGQAAPVFIQPLRPELHVCGCAPLQRLSPAAHAGAVQTPFVHKAVVAHAGPFDWYPVRSALQISGCAPLQRT